MYSSIWSICKRALRLRWIEGFVNNPEVFLAWPVSEPPITRQPCSNSADVYTSGFNFAPILWQPCQFAAASLRPFIQNSLIIITFLL